MHSEIQLLLLEEAKSWDPRYDDYLNRYNNLPKSMSSCTNASFIQGTKQIQNMTNPQTNNKSVRNYSNVRSILPLPA